MIWFRVEQRSSRRAMKAVLVSAQSREHAKARAHPFLFGDPEDYVVEPLTTPAQKVYVIGEFHG